MFVCLKTCVVLVVLQDSGLVHFLLFSMSNTHFEFWRYLYVSSLSSSFLFSFPWEKDPLRPQAGFSLLIRITAERGGRKRGERQWGGGGGRRALEEHTPVDSAAPFTVEAVNPIMPTVWPTNTHKYTHLHSPPLHTTALHHLPELLVHTC